ncbi:MAG TPA: porin family protein [Planctomycetota bacterium]|nr:porin family protein [Planctomycetota bacterium]
MIFCAMLLCSATFTDAAGEELARLPRTLGEEAPEARAEAEELVQDKDRKAFEGEEKRTEFTLGPRVGYLKTRDAERGTWLVGVQARLRILKFLGAEASVGYHQDEFLDGDVRVHTYPVELTGMIYPFPDLAFELYGLAGVGWYYTRFTFHDSLSTVDDETDSQFGVHVGAGAAVDLTRRVSLNGDFRWIFLDEPGVDNGNLDEEEFDRWQVTAGINFTL